jgi:hypothetical protein
VLVVLAWIAGARVSNSEKATDRVQPAISKRLVALLLRSFWGWPELCAKEDRQDIFAKRKIVQHSTAGIQGKWCKVPLARKQPQGKAGPYVARIVESR